MAAAAKMVRYGGSNLHYIHDSKVDFLKNAEPFHYFRMRVIQESTVSVWREASDWVSEQASAAKEGVERVVETGIGWLRHVFSEGKKTSGRGQDKVDGLF